MRWRINWSGCKTWCTQSNWLKLKLVITSPEIFLTNNFLLLKLIIFCAHFLIVFYSFCITEIDWGYQKRNGKTTRIRPSGLVWEEFKTTALWSGQRFNWFRFSWHAKYVSEREGNYLEIGMNLFHTWCVVHRMNFTYSQPLGKNRRLILEQNRTLQKESC